MNVSKRTTQELGGLNYDQRDVAQWVRIRVRVRAIGLGLGVQDFGQGRVERGTVGTRNSFNSDFLYSLRSSYVGHDRL